MRHATRLLCGAAAVLAVGLAGPSLAETVAITHAHIYSMGPAGEIPSGTVVIADGKIAAVGASAAVPAGARVIDAQGAVVAPGFLAVGAPLGVDEVGEGVPETNDDGTASTQLSAAFDPSSAVNPNSVLLPIARMAGTTDAVITPELRRSRAPRPEPLMFSGQASVIQLGGGDDLVEKTHVGVVLEMGETGGRLAGGSRAAQIGLLHEILADVRAYAHDKARYDEGRSRPLSLGRADLEALIPVAEGKEPLIASVSRAADIREIIRFARDEKLNLILEGADEGWMVAPLIAAAHVPVLLRGYSDLPATFDQLGARLDNAALLHAAGVTVVIENPPIYEGGRSPRIDAGRAVAHGLPFLVALAAVTSTPAKVFGLQDRLGSIAPGRDADLVIWSGDPLEPLSSPLAVFIKGVSQPMRSRDTELRDRYLWQAHPAAP